MLGWPFFDRVQCSAPSLPVSIVIPQCSLPTFCHAALPPEAGVSSRDPAFGPLCGPPSWPTSDVTLAERGRAPGLVPEGPWGSLSEVCGVPGVTELLAAGLCHRDTELYSDVVPGPQLHVRGACYGRKSRLPRPPGDLSVGLRSTSLVSSLPLATRKLGATFAARVVTVSRTSPRPSCFPPPCSQGPSSSSQGGLRALNG